MTFVLELSQEGLAELERRLDKLELEEARQGQRDPIRHWIQQLLINPRRKKMHQLPLAYHDLPRDPLRVRKVRKASLKRECAELTIALEGIKNQIQIVMGNEDSENEIARLNDSKARIEKELRQKQEELARLS